MSVLLSLYLLQAASAAPSVSADASASPPDDLKKVCKTITPTGSRLGGKRTCMTKKEWRRLQQESAETAQEYQNHQSKQPGNQ